MQDQIFKQSQKTYQQLQEFNNSGGISLHLLQNTKIDIQHLLCYLCKQILLKPITCNHPNCFTNFCQACLDKFENTKFQPFKQQQNKNSQKITKKCPNCKNKIQKAQLPLIKNLLTQIILKCQFNSYGCNEKIKYEHFLKHNQNCLFKKIKCSGCNQNFFKNQYAQHIQTCQSIKIKCKKCHLQISRAHIKQHESRQCLQQQLKLKNIYLTKVQTKVLELEQKVNYYEIIIQKLIKGDPLKLQPDIQTSFPNNFKIDVVKKQVILQKASYNSLKQKYDFLHFYIRNPITTCGIVGMQWRMRIKRLKGNLLMGICSSLNSNSIDLVMNKYGEIKKKQTNQNRYRLIRKSEISFSQGDLISFRFEIINKSIQIRNQSKFNQGKLTWQQIGCLGKEFYTFYSFDTQGDCIQFV